MAPLTWRNVDAPDMGSAARIYESAGSGFSQGLAGLGKSLSGIGTARNTRASAGALPILAQVANEQGVDAAINRVSGMVNPNQWSPELQAAVMGLRENALGYEKTRADTGYVGANTARVLGGENRDQTDFTRRIASEDQLMGQAGDIVRMNQAAYAGNAGTGISPASAALGRAAGGQVSSSSTLSQLLNKHEGAGNYDTLYGHSQKNGPFAGTRVSEMSVGDAIRFSDPKGPYAQWVKDQVGRVATPMGAGQIVGTTLKSAVTEMGLDPNTRFDEATQNAVIDHLGRKRIAASSTIEGKRAGLRAEWEGFKNVPDAELDRVIGEMESGKPASVGSSNTGGMYDPALGANYSTVQQQGGQAVVPDVASLVPASGNKVLPDAYLKMVSDNWKAGDTARVDMDADRERDRTFERSVITGQRNDRDDARSEEVIATTEEAKSRVDVLLQSVVDPLDAQPLIMNDASLDPDLKSAMLTRVTDVAGAAPAQFTPGELSLGAQESANALGAKALEIETRSQQTRMTDGLLQLQDEAAAATAAGTDMLSEAQTLKDEGAFPLHTSPSEIVRVANTLSEEFGVTPQFVIGAMKQNLKPDGWLRSTFMPFGDVTVDDKRIRDFLTEVTDGDSFRASRELSAQLDGEKAEIDKAMADYQKHAGNAELLASRPGPAAATAAASELEKAQAAFLRAEAVEQASRARFDARKKQGRPGDSGSSGAAGQEGAEAAPTQSGVRSGSSPGSEAISAAAQRVTASQPAPPTPAEIQASVQAEALPQGQPPINTAAQDGSYETQRAAEEMAEEVDRAVKDLENRRKAMENRRQRNGEVLPADVERVNKAQQRLNALLQKAAEQAR